MLIFVISFLFFLRENEEGKITYSVTSVTYFIQTDISYDIVTFLLSLI
jgi:hypothetical protein